VTTRAPVHREGMHCIPERTRELEDVSIHVRETSSGCFEATFRPNSPAHLARQGFAVDTRRGARGKTLAQVLDWAEGYWRQNYPLPGSS
jgi:hypothetical protein